MRELDVEPEINSTATRIKSLSQLNWNQQHLRL